MEVLQLQKVFDLPPRSIRESLLDSFWQRCYPWTPIVERSWVDRPHDQISPLLLQSMLLAGSRVLSAPLNFGSSEEFYRKSKMLFWMGVEKQPLILTAAACLLHWWNPEGPEHVSIDTSAFWLRISVGLAYQIGLHREPGRKPDASLRRRLWWSLVTRDCLINAGHGRPRAINLKLSDVSPPSINDFDGISGSCDIFRAYVGISMIMGDLTGSFLRKYRFQQQRLSLENSLFRWIKTLPETLQLCFPQPERSLRPYCFESRQMHVQYFTVLTILTKSLIPGGPPSTASLLASSFIAGMFEDFLARDEIRFLGPIFTFYLLCAGVSQLGCFAYAGLWHLAEQDINIIFKSLEELSKRWPSAVGSLKNLVNVREKVSKRPRASYLPENNLSPEQMQFFDLFGRDLCREWDALYCGANTRQSAVTKDLMTAGILTDLRTPSTISMDVSQRLPPIQSTPDQSIGPVDTHLLDPGGRLDQYLGIGNWLLSDWDSGMAW